MSWTKGIKDALLITVNSIVLYSVTCLVFSLINKLPEDHAASAYDSNTIRATYPNYEQENIEFAVKIFEDYAAPTSSYHSFVGYRRNKYHGEAVTVDTDGFRESINHGANDSVWFFGGSTMWGTGADDNRTIPSIFSKETGENRSEFG